MAYTRDEISLSKSTYDENDQLHSYDDKPAIINRHGKMSWYDHGLIHRDNDLPAIITSEYKTWYKYGKVHRDNDKPARVFSDGFEEWYQNDKLHRENDQPALIHSDFKSWYRNGLLHRDPDSNGNPRPSLIHKNGSINYYTNGKEFYLEH
jgi:hypothetical protein